MSFLASVICLIVSMLVCIFAGISLSWGLLVGMFAFMSTALRMGHSLKSVLKMMWDGVRESLIVVVMLIIVGALTGIWRAGGTIPQIVTYGIHLIRPNMFILSAFLLAMAVSYLIGTSTGTCATIGVVLMTLCKVGGGSLPLTAGAALAGAFFGDRASPASSCAHLVAYLTGTDIYDNVKRMLKNCILPTAIVILIYGILSRFYPLQAVSSGFQTELASSYRLSPWLLLPAVIILVTPLLKTDIKLMMTVSILLSCLFARFLQGMSAAEILRTLVFGFEAKGNLKDMLSGGGMMSMMNGNIMIMIAATFSGIFNGTDMLRPLEEKLKALSGKLSLYSITLLTSYPLIALSFNQTLSLMLQTPLLKPLYREQGKTDSDLMLDLSNTTVLLAATVPWCLAVSVPLEVMDAGLSAIPLAFFLYVPAIVNLLRKADSCSG